MGFMARKTGKATAARRLAVAFIAAVLTAGPAGAERLPSPEDVFADATRFGAVEGTPPAAPAYRDEALVGYVLSTKAVVASAGFSGKPLNVLVGIDLEGRITGAHIVEHHEPILVLGIPDSRLQAFVDQFRGLDIRKPVRVERGAGEDALEAVAGATISSVVLGDTILQAARAVARSRGILGGGPRVDLVRYETTDWPSLVAEGAFAQRLITVGEVETALARRGGRLFPKGVEPPEPGAVFLDLQIALATPAGIGRNLLGDPLYNRITAGLAEGDHLIFVAASGLYSFKGTAYVRSGVFDRIQLVQGDRTIHFLKPDHVRIDEVMAAGTPELREAAVFTLRGDAGFSPLQPWRLELLVTGKDAAGEAVFAVFDLPYALPAAYVITPPPEEAAAEDEPLWMRVWRGQVMKTAVLVVGLLVLTVILVFQDTITRRARLHHRLRLGFLTFTLLWIGWYAGAQLSVVNVLTFIEAMRSGFRWDFFLLDPLLFVLWGYVAVAMLFWARGVYCGWLCPFGALQELSNKLARRLGVPQLKLPFALHERLWPIKYVIFLGLFGVSLNAMQIAQTGAEVEPFKTAIVLRFDRAWPFAAYAGALVLAGLFIERFFCRYLCPLGAALAIPARLRMFDWLRRRKECGAECHICEARCPVQAIHPNGRINVNECVYCLDCEVLYYDEGICPPLVRRRKRREKRAPGEVVARMLREAKPPADGGGETKT